jgi:hypothetical protein
MKEWNVAKPSWTSFGSSHRRSQQHRYYGRVSRFISHPRNEKQLMQWVKKGQPGPIKARVYATRSKQTVLVFFDAKGVIYTNYVLKGKTVNTKYIKKAGVRFQQIFRRRGPSCRPRTGGCTGTTPPPSVHTVATVSSSWRRRS